MSTLIPILARAATIVAFLALILLHGCSEKQSEVQFIVPDGFRGEILIIEDNENGLDNSGENGVYKYVIPKNGRLLVKSFEPFRKWHQERTSFANGDVIANENTQGNNHKIRFFGGGVTRDQTNPHATRVYYVGTKEEAEKYFKMKHPAK